MWGMLGWNIRAETSQKIGFLKRDLLAASEEIHEKQLRPNVGQAPYR